MMPDQAPALDMATTTGSALLVLSLVLPVAALLLAFAAGGRHVERIALATMPIGLAVAVAIVVLLLQARAPLVYLVGAWMPPLGVALRADGLSATMMMVAAVVICAIGVFARADFRIPAGAIETRAPFAFWILILGVWGALNLVFLGGDLFTLYVGLELLTFAAVPLVSLDGRAETLQAALRYLLFALLGSVLYLVGTALLYGAYGTLDIVLLSQRVRPEPTTLVAAALMTVGLLAKTALVPLHLWLPPAHAGAPAAASAALSALVVKGSFFIAVRLWFDVMPGLPGFAAAQFIATLGAAAIVLGSVVALRQVRLKLLIAYSTLAQLGYLFLMFALAFDPASAQLRSGGALAGGMMQAISHATAKAAMFMSAGLIYAALGHDRITGLGGVGRMLPLSVTAFAIGGVALVGVPTSGAYLAKDLMLQAATETRQWWWPAIIQAGGIFTSGYLVLVLAHALAPADEPLSLRSPASRMGEAAALLLALCSLLLGLVPWETLLSVPPDAASSPLSLGTLWKTLWPLLAGAVLALLLGQWGPGWTRIHSGKTLAGIIGPARRPVLALGRAVELTDSVLRQWPAAGLALVIVAILLVAAMLAGR
jgi:formate hydrogenlyase subunit 3/multisubunit Na+/H+ antiporter MnhD subunit